jgi:UDP-2-acetamido-3-amino-2,3-dideoxy-glucuronate N-acetyltransferase
MSSGVKEYFVHQLADVQTEQIGPGTRIWQFAVILEGATIGRDCNLCAHTFVEGGVTIGDRVTVKSGVYLWNGLIIEDDVLLGPQATFTNDSQPRSKRYKPPESTLIRAGASVGAGAVVLPGLTIGRGAMIGAGAVVTRSVPDGETWIGNPARPIRRGDAARER